MKGRTKPRVLLIGGNGFIGSHLVDELLLREYPVRVLDRQGELFRQPIAGVEYITGSFADLFNLREAIDGCEILVHLAHSTIPSASLNHPEQEVLDSVGAFVNMVNCFKKSTVRKIVLFSSGGAVYGNSASLPVTEDAGTSPISPYGVAKLMMEKYLEMFNYLYGLHYIIVRPSNPFGARQNYHGQQGVIPIFFDRIMRGEKIQIWGDGVSEKDYLYVDDVARATVMLMDKGFDNSIYNISSGTGRNLKKLAAAIGSVCGLQPRLEYVAGRRHDVKNIILSHNKLHARTGWRPAMSFEKGLELTYTWIQQREDGKRADHAKH